MTALHAVAAITLVASTAAAAPASDEPTAVDVAGAPAPGDESGRLDPPPPADSTLRRIGRGALFVPRVAVRIALAPARAGVWGFQRYQVAERWRQWFFNDAGTFGVYPTAQYDAGYGINLGGRLIHDDLFGAEEKLALRAGVGGLWSQVYGSSLHTGRRLGEHLSLELSGRYERRPKDLFFGIGDRDALVADTADETRYRERIARGSAIADLRVVGDLHVRASGALADITLARSDRGPPIDEVYAAQVMGLAPIRHAYGELELRWDSRRSVSPWEPRSVFASGWLAAAFAGRVRALDDRTDYTRYGIDLQHFLRVGAGPRVLAVRGVAEAVTGGRDEVPFTQLPALGGPMLLRGYLRDRFRDRVAMMASLEYAWDLSRFVSASAFVDAGRVYAGLDDVALEGIRVGYGVALEAHSDRSFLLRGSIASSIDGGVLVDLAFAPVFEAIPRVERR